jgi:hypothetical protein
MVLSIPLAVDISIPEFIRIWANMFTMQQALV